MTSPLQHRRTSGLKHAWKMWMFDRKAKKQARVREREFQALLRKR